MLRQQSLAYACQDREFWQALERNFVRLLPSTRGLNRSRLRTIMEGHFWHYQDFHPELNIICLLLSGVLFEPVLFGPGVNRLLTYSGVLCSILHGLMIPPVDLGFLAMTRRFRLFLI